MKRYIQIEFQDLSPEMSGILIAELNHIGFDGFEEEGNNLKACIPESCLNELVLKELTEKRKLFFRRSMIEETNWNAVWESGFRPVLVDDFVGIRAAFHEPVQQMEWEIVITPKMSFGTGHHATTQLMIQQMRDIEFAGKTILDFGTGTGVLAILAEKLGAQKILAIDHDEWSISNASENAEQNGCTRIQIIKADCLQGDEKFNIILANINKNVILDNFSELKKKISPGGILLLSGLLIDDEADILSSAEKYSLYFNRKNTGNGWICLRFDS